MQENTNTTEDAEAIEIKSLSLVDATIATAKKSFAELVRDTPIDKKAKELKAILKKIEIKDTSDKENYNKVKVISKDASKVRIAVEKRRKELKADIITAGKSIDALAGEYQALINPIENDADAKLKIIDDAIELEKTRKEREDAQRLDDRVKTLIESGMTFTGSWYEIGDISVGIQAIGEMDIEKFADLKLKVETQNAKNIEAKKLADEAEQKRLQEIENQRLENERIQKENEAKQKELDDKLKAIADAEKALADKQKAQSDLEEKNAKEAKEKADRELLKQRAQPFEDIGFVFSYANESWTKKVSANDSFTISKQQLLAGIIDFETVKADVETAIGIENKRIADAEEKTKLENRNKQRNQELTNIGFVQILSSQVYEHKLGFIYDNINEITDEEFNALLEDTKIQLDKIVEDKRLSLLDDTEKYTEFVNQLKAVSIPEVIDISIASKINNIIKAINQ